MHRSLAAFGQKTLTRLILALVVAGATSFAAAPAAHATPHVKAHSGEAGIALGGYFFVHGSGALKDTFDYRLHGAYNFTKLVGLELAFGIAPTKGTNQSWCIRLKIASRCSS